jgi:ABC-2 type transport system ATP-binding protein
MGPLFQLLGLTHYYGSVCALRDITLSVPTGAIGLIGENGAGKSTLLQVLLGLIRPTSGTVHVLGSPLHVSACNLRGRMGFMPERDAFLPGLKGVEYVALAGELCGMSRRQALRRAHETLSYLGLEEARYRLLEQYSVGMKQRLKLAATLIHDPDLLLLDEPTAGLDPDGRSAMLEVLRVLAARPNKSLLLASHLLGDIEKVCQTAVLLHAGRVVGSGSIAELCSVSTRNFRIQWEGDGARLLRALAERQVQVQPGSRPGEALVIVPEGWSNRNFFAAAKQQQVLLTGLEPEEERLEALYQRLIGRNVEGDSPIFTHHASMVSEKSGQSPAEKSGQSPHSET